ncbi:MAG: response regulator [Chloroflexi bacterium]|nr:response regulator [Chloroflexota bacterium]
MNADPFPILLVEDSKHDVRFVRRAWRINRITNPLFIVPHGQACLDFLHHRGEYGDGKVCPRPGIVLMDIRMPVMDGIECLQAIRSDPEFKTLPVIMLTTSREDQDRVHSYELGCNTFIEKPVDFDKFSAAVRAIQVYWTLSTLP